MDTRQPSTGNTVHATRYTQKLLGIESDAKTVKGSRYGYMTGIVYLAPGNLSGRELCAFRTDGCSASCLNTAGHGQFDSTQRARITKTQRFTANPVRFVDDLSAEITKLERRARARQLQPVVRLNGTSDLPWEHLRGSDGQTLMAQHARVQFYDYTKNAPRFTAQRLPKNYHLTFSRSEKNEQACRRFLWEHKGTVSVVFGTKKGQPLPSTWHGYRVIDGDTHDLRFLDPRGIVVGLRAKGRAKQDTTGFVVR